MSNRTPLVGLPAAARDFRLPARHNGYCYRCYDLRRLNRDGSCSDCGAINVTASIGLVVARREGR